MDIQKDSYLLFFLAGFHFLLPLVWVEHVTAMSGRDPELPVADFMNRPEGAEQAYLIIVDCGDRKLGIKAETVTGLVRVEEDRICALPEAVKSAGNRYVSGMVLVDAAEGDCLAYVLDPLRLVPRPLP